MPQLNYKIAALEQVLETAPLQQTDAVFHGKNYDILFRSHYIGYEKSQPGPDGQPMVTMDEVIHDISFTAKEGQKTALVGESGSGKSTLAKLLIHYYDPQQGSHFHWWAKNNGNELRGIEQSGFLRGAGSVFYSILPFLKISVWGGQTLQMKKSLKRRKKHSAWNFLKSCRRGFIRWREMPGKCFLAVNDSVFLWHEPF